METLLQLITSLRELDTPLVLAIAIVLLALCVLTLIQKL